LIDLPDEADEAALHGTSAFVDVQLVDDTIANDAVFTREMRAPGPGPQYTPMSLAERLGINGIARVRCFVAELVSRLAGNTKSLVLFAKGIDLSRGDSGDVPEDFVVVHACADQMRLNGRVTIFGIPTNELATYDHLLGDFDTLRGVATTADRLSDTLRLLPLHEPVPTTTPWNVLGPASFATLDAALQTSRFFFEEVRNGTRLRLISRFISADEVGAAVRAATAALA
jgi:hypothetical protein